MSRWLDRFFAEPPVNRCVTCGVPGDGAGIWTCDTCYQARKRNEKGSNMNCMRCGQVGVASITTGLCQKCLSDVMQQQHVAQMLQNASLAQMHQNANLAQMHYQPWGIIASSLPAPKPAPLTHAGMKVEDLIGWRIWRLRNGYLTAYSQNYVWLPNEVAEGEPGDHDTQGVWAFKTPRLAVTKLVDNTGPHVWGSVRLWGSVVEHAHGFRAAKARIISLDGATDGVPDETFERLRRRYGA